MFHSAKFKFINNTQYKHYIPKVCNAKDFIDDNQLIDSGLILRSSLKGEGDQYELKSGVSQTIHQIKTKDQLKAALEKIKQQEGLDEYILQEEVFHHTHLTVYIENNFVFGEVTGTREFFIMNSQTQTGDLAIINALSPLIKLIQKEEVEPVLCEIGLGAENSVYLFQLMTIKDHPIQEYIKNDLFKILVQKKDIYLRKGLLNLIKTEYLAYKIRNDKSRNKYTQIEQVFFNWISLLHYFRLYCMQEKIISDARAWQKFLIASIDKKSWVLKNAYAHIQISSQLRQTEDMPELPAGFKTEEKIFLGKGEFRGEFDKEIVRIKHLDVASVLSLSDDIKVIISEYSSMLSHPCLLLIERGVYFVGGLNTDYLDNIPQGSQIQINFDKRTISLL